MPLPHFPHPPTQVQILSCLIDAIAKHHNITKVLDIGAGQGYLDAALAFGYRHTVIGVDDDEVQTCGAKRRTGLIEKLYARPKNRAQAVGRLLHVNRRVTASESFTDLLAEVADDRWLLCGLHTCGDLAPAMIRHFLESNAQVLVGVGCCYNKLTELDGAPPPAPHPRAATSAPASPADIPTSPGRPGRMLSCQATCRWATDPSAADNFTRHFYRALLQLLIHSRGLIPPGVTTFSLTVGRLGRRAFDNGFAGYAQLALPRLGIDAEAAGLDAPALNAYWLAHAEREKEVAVAWTLRALVAEALESLILVDRFAYLEEVGGAGSEGEPPSVVVDMFPLFEYVDSPRNMVIVAQKRT
ncbi:methyltransferase domain-containing protein [Blyttiomyces helicus]|uniref:Methyltransferase domain-containing protein n=1 Tax=Blyttiomyces helicus TaxID=388810 RepID=A0A4P9W0U7_9FUNG|nr:methyltransferase domain-containing protein [Blyttiomyces helicus]|eukprot:RKO84955.1 methyltransferase domain-containing protein [Blyttiomyces helicus]